METVPSYGIFDANFYYTSGTEKQQKINWLINLFNNPVGASYETLLEYVRDNFEELATFRNLATRTVDYFYACDPATTIQEAIVLLAMKKFMLSEPKEVQPRHIHIVIFDLLGTHNKEAGCFGYDTATDYRYGVLEKSINGCDFSEGIKALEKRLLRVPLSPDAIAYPQKPEAQYSPPFTMALALRPPVKYEGQGLDNVALPATTAKTAKKRGVKCEPSTTTIQDIWNNSHLLGIPTVSNQKDLNVHEMLEIRIGDTSGNIILDIQQLIKTGILSIINNERYKVMMECLDGAVYGAVHDTEIDAYICSYNPIFQGLLKEALESNLDSASVLYLGDRINDNVGNDMYVLDLTTFLCEMGVNFTILASNHDLEAVRAYLKLKDMSRDDALALIRKVAYADPQAITHDLVCNGFISCMRTLSEQPDLYEQYQKGMENYIENMVVYQFCDTNGLLCGHAPPSEYSINSIAMQAGMKQPWNAELGLKVALINRWFKEEVLQSSESFEKYYPDVENVNYTKFPLYSATSGTGCHCGQCEDSRGSWRDAQGWVLEASYEKPKGASYVEHGHIFTPPHLNDNTIATLDSEFGCVPFVNGQWHLDRVFGNHKVGITIRENPNLI